MDDIVDREFVDRLPTQLILWPATAVLCESRDCPELNWRDERFASQNSAISAKQMNETEEFVSAMLAITIAAVMLVAGQLYIAKGPKQSPTVQAAPLPSAS